MKTLNTLKKYVIAGMVLGASCVVTLLPAADHNDHIVVIRSPQTVEQIVNVELQSARFAEQIASYNGIASAGTVLAVGTTLSIPKPYLESIDHGRIAFVKGDVAHTQTDRVVNPPAKGASVRNGDVFRTGIDGFVSLSFNSGARVNVQPDSRVLIKDIDCATASAECVISVNAISGQVHSEVTPRPDGQPQIKFTIETPFLTAAVRGTAFYVDLNGKENRIGVTRGLVATDSAGASNDLPGGKGLSVKPGVVPEVVDLLDPPGMSIQSETLLVSAEDNISWLPLDGANSYQVNIAVDSAMAEPVFVQRTNSPIINPDLTPGSYYFSVAGVDNKEFIGLPALQEITYAEITDTQKPGLDIVRRGKVVELSLSGQAGPAQLLIGNSIESDVYETRILNNAAEQITLELDENQEWVFRARRIFGPEKVSAYSDYYVLPAAAK